MEQYLTNQSAHILRERLAVPVLSPAEETDDQVINMTYVDFLDWCPDGLHAEWINGKVLVKSPASLRHQQIVAFLVSLLSEYVKRYGLGEVVPAPFQMRMPEQGRGREPDLLFVATDHLDRITETNLDGPADLVIEVISPESELRDRGEKFSEYEAAGVQEYWIIDPRQEDVSFFVLDTARRYRPAEIDERGFYRSAVLPDIKFEVDWLWEESLPSIIDILTNMPSPEQRP